MVKLTTFVIRPGVYEGEVLGREVKLLTKDQFKLFQEVAREAVLVLEDVDEVFMGSYKLKDS